MTADPSLSDQSCDGVSERSLKLLPFPLPVQPEVEDKEKVEKIK